MQKKWFIFAAASRSFCGLYCESLVKKPFFWWLQFVTLTILLCTIIFRPWRFYH